MIDETIESKRHDESTNDRAVSPVIGVILMVAITVILAAVIAAFVLDLGPGEPDPTAGVTIDGDGSSSVDVQLNSLGDNADGIVIAEGDADDIKGNVTITGGTVTIGETGEYNVYAVSGNVTGITQPNDADALAIVDGFEVE